VTKRLLRLRLERMKAGLTQVELSINSNVPQSCISCAERGLPVLNERHQKNLAEFFQIDSKELLKEVSW
jgi:ribosome-binding protein aMBF1 (putative translation factor)